MRFQKGNTYASRGGRARAQKLSAEERKEIARAGRQAVVEKIFEGDAEAQRQWWRELSLYNYETQVGEVTGGYGRQVQAKARHPGNPAQWYEWYKTGKRSSNGDVDFYPAEEER